MITNILSALFYISVILINPLATLCVHAGSDLNDPSTIGTVENANNDSYKFETKIPKINELLKSLLEQVSDMQSLNKDEKLILLHIQNSYNEIKKESTLNSKTLNPLLTQHVAGLISLAIKRSQELTGTNYRTPQLQSDTISPDSIVSSHYASTRDLAYSLKANDVATLLILNLLAGSIKLQEQTREDIGNYKHSYTMRTLSLTSMATSLFSLGATFKYIDYTNMPAFITAIVATAFVAGPLSYISYFKPLHRDNLNRQNTESLARSRQFLIDALQSQLGDGAAPLIEALRTGDTDAIRSAACQYNLTPVSSLRARVDVNSSGELQAEEVTRQEQQRQQEREL